MAARNGGSKRKGGIASQSKRKVRRETDASITHSQNPRHTQPTQHPHKAILSLCPQPLRNCSSALPFLPARSIHPRPDDTLLDQLVDGFRSFLRVDRVEEGGEVEVGLEG